MKVTVVTGFCFGHLIHSGLMLGYQIVYLRAEGQEFYDCASIATLLLDVLYPVYSFLQLFFIFKYSNVSASTESDISQNAQILKHYHERKCSFPQLALYNQSSNCTDMRTSENILQT